VPSSLPAADCYTSVAHNIEVTVSKWSSRFNMDRDDTLSIAHEAFMSAFHSYDKAAGSEFNSWVTYLIEKKLLSYVRKQAARNQLLPRQEMEMDDLPGRATVGFDLDDWLDGLAPDVRFLAESAVDPPPDVKAILHRLKWDTPANTRRALRAFLRECGWTWNRISKAFREVRNSL
jgi:hypothetical protein